MPLHIDYRPKTLDELIGNESIKTSLKSIFDREDKPHSYLFHGPSGSGKTTLGRIIANMLNCEPEDLMEYNSANTRGIDTIRDIAEGVHYAALVGSVRVYILDECFAKGTKVRTNDGERNIEEIKIGDEIQNLLGKSKVTHTFINKVPLNRIVRLEFTNGTSTYTTVDHQFLTIHGWTSACRLTKKDLLFFFDGDLMSHIKLQKGEHYDDKEILRMVRKGISCTLPKETNLLSRTWAQNSRTRTANLGSNSKEEMPGLWKRISSENKSSNSLQPELLQSDCKKEDSCQFIGSKETFGLHFLSQGVFGCAIQATKILFQYLCNCFSDKKTFYKRLRMVQKRIFNKGRHGAFLFTKLQQSLPFSFTSRSDQLAFSRTQGENKISKTKHGPIEKSRTCRNEFCSNESKQSVTEFFVEQKSYCDKESKRNTHTIQKNREREQWSWSNRFRELASCFFGRSMGMELCCEAVSGEANERISNLLQNRCGQSFFEDRDRNRRLVTQSPRTERTGSEENKPSDRIRVESVEVYERGSNDKAFESVIGDKERDQGFVEFYDLEIKDHPSYFANDVLVHNCHMITGAASNALLKLLEDTPKHVYFILCTTEPDKLLKTMRTRCTSFQTSLLLDAQMKKLIEWVLKEEEITDFPASIVKEIVRVSEGCPRQALVTLDAVIDIVDEKEALKAISSVSSTDAEVKDVITAMIAHKSWKEIKGKVKEVLTNTEPEKFRYAVLGYCSAILLNKDNDDRLSELIDLFSEPTYATGKAGIVNTCYLSCK